jgi:glycosyltransferase involved in cell wall biosynthesis
MKKKLYILTDSFPYGEGEKSFLIPELEYLNGLYDIVIISCATNEDRLYSNMETILDDSIKVVHYELGDVKGIEVFKYFIPFILDGETWKEICRISKSGKKFIKRIKSCMFFYANSYKLHKWMEKNSLFKENAIYYSYWYNYHVLSIVRERSINKKIITRAHGYDLYKEQSNSGWQPYKQYMDKYLDRVVFISQDGYDYYISHYISDNMYNSSKYWLCRLGTDRHEPIMEDTRKIKGNNPFLLVSCSSMISLKRVDMIIEGLSLLDDENINWVHFGTGEQEKIIIKLAKDKLDNKPNIIYEFKGLVDNDKIMEYYQTKKPDGFITTSKNEGSPVSIQEAISFGIPVIGTNIGGIPEMIDGNGILIPVNMKPEDVAEAVMKIYNMDSDQYISMRKKSFEIWKKDYDRNKNLRKFVQIIEN